MKEYTLDTLPVDQRHTDSHLGANSLTGTFWGVGESSSPSPLKPTRNSLETAFNWGPGLHLDDPEAVPRQHHPLAHHVDMHKFLFEL